MNRLNNFFFAVLLLLFSSCVSIKPSTVELSAEIGSRISEMERVHQMAIQRYFDMEKEKVEDFLEQTWEPHFLKNFLGMSKILDKLQKMSTVPFDTRAAIRAALVQHLKDDTTETDRAMGELMKAVDASRAAEPGVVRNALKRFFDDDKLDAVVIHVVSLLGTDEPARTIMDFAQAAHDEMNAQRKLMMEPIEQARLETTAALSESYSELIRGQSTITGRLEAASRVSRQQDELIGKLGLNDIAREVTEKLSAATTKVNAVLVKSAEEIQKVDKNNKIDLINDLKEAFKDFNGIGKEKAAEENKTNPDKK